MVVSSLNSWPTRQRHGSFFKGVEYIKLLASCQQYLKVPKKSPSQVDVTKASNTILLVDASEKNPGPSTWRWCLNSNPGYKKIVDSPYATGEFTTPINPPEPSNRPAPKLPNLGRFPKPSLGNPAHRLVFFCFRLYDDDSHTFMRELWLRYCDTMWYWRCLPWWLMIGADGIPGFQQLRDPKKLPATHLFKRP